ncbi:MmcQ family protein [Streptococcus sp. X16XC17]|uniref:MmcQ/YjbR family DNA-binding protein n=2 Tax=unclassified Streptococcus TaxID=2608887 RepID=UPI00066FD686|nr:MmcQ/YjbR family DNA-binding protein [Streptococcus sp. X16XC17]TCD46749.1 MmcQ family protein [Streptococcus sp. X16XC17]
MGFEEQYFKQKKLVRESLFAFGFSEVQEGYLYQEKFLEDNFEARISISKEGHVSGEIWDLDVDEAYTAFRAVHVTGKFIGRVREEYGRILEDIAKNCFVETPLVSDQGNRLAQWILQTFGDVYDHPFEKHPTFFSYRNPVNSKWYALVMKVPRKKLAINQENWSQEQLEEEAEIVNFKVDPDQITKLVRQRGIYPSYHMNKSSWISLVLDDSVDDALLYSLIEKSRQLTMPRGFQNPTGPDMWVIPANPKMFDIDAEFAKTKRVYWRQKGTIQAGDLVAMYITTPVRAIRYLCRVLEVQIPAKDGGKNRMLVELVYQFEDEAFSATRMAELGVKAVRGPRRVTKELADAIHAVWSKENIEKL